jgi:hypothetical protein
MKNTFKTQALLALLMLLGVSSLIAMDNGQDGKKRGLEEEREENPTKKLCYGQDLRVTEEEWIDLAVLEDMESDGERIEWFEEHFRNSMPENCFYEVIIMAYDQEWDDFLDVVLSQADSLLKAMVENDQEMIRGFLSKDGVVHPKLLYIAMLLEVNFGYDGIFDLLLDSVSMHDLHSVSQGEVLIERFIDSDVGSRELNIYISKMVNKGFEFTLKELCYWVNGEDVLGEDCFRLFLSSVKDFSSEKYSNRLLASVIENTIENAQDDRLIQLVMDGVPLSDDPYYLVCRIVLPHYYSVSGSDVMNMSEKGRAVVRILEKAYASKSVDFFQDYLKKIMPQLQLWLYVKYGKLKSLEQLLLDGVDVNMPYPCLRRLDAMAVELRDAHCLKILLAYGYSMRCATVKMFRRNISQFVVQSMRVFKAIQDFSDDKRLLLKNYLEDDCSKKESYYLQIVLRCPKVAQCIFMHSPYRFIHPQCEKFIFDKEKKQICKVTHEEWLECELKKNVKRLDNDGKNKPGSQELCTWFLAGKNLQQRLSDTKFSDVVIKTQT